MTTSQFEDAIAIAMMLLKSADELSNASFFIAV